MKQNYLQTFFVILAFLINVNAGFTQEINHKPCKDKDLQDFFKKKGDTVTVEKPQVIMMMPVVYYNPTNGFAFGVGGLLGKVFGPKETTKISSATMNIVVTTKKQFLAPEDIDLLDRIQHQMTRTEAKLRNQFKEELK